MADLQLDHSPTLILKAQALFVWFPLQLVCCLGCCCGIYIHCTLNYEF